MKMDSITSMNNVGEIPGSIINNNNPSHVTSKNLNIASLLSLQEPDPIKAAMEKKSSKMQTTQTRFVSTEDSNNLNE